LVIVHLGKLAAAQSSRKAAEAAHGPEMSKLQAAGWQPAVPAVRLLTIQNRYVTTANGINY